MRGLRDRQAAPCACACVRARTHDASTPAERRESAAVQAVQTRTGPHRLQIVALHAREQRHALVEAARRACRRRLRQRLEHHVVRRRRRARPLRAHAPTRSSHAHGATGIVPFEGLGGNEWFQRNEWLHGRQTRVGEQAERTRRVQLVRGEGRDVSSQYGREGGRGGGGHRELELVEKLVGLERHLGAARRPLHQRAGAVAQRTHAARGGARRGAWGASSFCFRQQLLFSAPNTHPRLLLTVPQYCQ